MGKLPVTAIGRAFTRSRQLDCGRCKAIHLSLEKRRVGNTQQQHTFNWVVGATDDQVTAEVSQFIMAAVAMMNQLDIMFPDQWTKEGTNA